MSIWFELVIIVVFVLARIVWLLWIDRDPLLEKQAKYYSRWKQD